MVSVHFALSTCFSLSEVSDSAVANRTVWLTPRGAPSIIGSSVVVGDRRIYSTDVNGEFTATDIGTGLIYEVTVLGPPLRTDFKIYVPLDASGTIEAADYMVAADTATFPAGSVAYAAAVTDQRYIRHDAVDAGDGIEIAENGTRIVITATGTSTSAGGGLQKVTGDSNITVIQTNGTAALSLNPNASPTFAGLVLSGLDGDITFSNVSGPNLELDIPGPGNVILPGGLQVANSLSALGASIGTAGQTSINSSGTVIAVKFAGDGSALTLLHADQISAGTLPGARLPGFNGDVVSLPGSTHLSLKSVGVAGTYQQVTTDGAGRVITGTNNVSFPLDVSVSGQVRAANIISDGTLSVGTGTPATINSSGTINAPKIVGADLSGCTGFPSVAGGVTSISASTNISASASTGNISLSGTTTPRILDFSLAQHDHSNAANGGQIPAASIGSGTIAAARMPRFTGDVVSNGGPGSTQLSLISTGSNGSYRQVQTDGAGRVVSGQNPTTFSGYAISDTSVGLAAALTDETGSGAGGVAVFNQSPTIVTPTIASFTNATHNHQNAAGGGTLDAAAIATGNLANARLSQSITVTGSITAAAIFSTGTLSVGGATPTTIDSNGTLTATKLFADVSRCTGFPASTGGGAVSSVSAGGVNITVSPTTGAVVVSGTNAPTLIDFTNATHNHQSQLGGSLLDGAAIGSGTLATARLAGNGVASLNSFLRGDRAWAPIVAGPQTLVDSGTIAWNLTPDAQQLGKLTFLPSVNGVRLLSLNNLVAGQQGVLLLQQDYSGTKTLTPPALTFPPRTANSKLMNGALTFSTGASAVDGLAFVFDGTFLYWSIAPYS